MKLLGLFRNNPHPARFYITAIEKNNPHSSGWVLEHNARGFSDFTAGTEFIVSAKRDAGSQVWLEVKIMKCGREYSATSFRVVQGVFDKDKVGKTLVCTERL